MNKLAFTLSLCLLACGGARPKPESAVPQYALAGILIPTDEIQAPPFVVEQKITGSFQGDQVSIDCVVQFKDKKLTVLGLTPFGTRAFSIEQTGVEVKFEKYVDRDMPVQPEMVLYDIHRVFFRGLPPGQSQGQDHSDLVTELHSGDYVIERRFQNMEGPTNLVVLTFDGPPAPVVAPHVHVANTAFGYALDIENSEQKQLDSRYTLEVQTTDVAPPSGPLPPGEPADQELPASQDSRVYTPPSAD